MTGPDDSVGDSDPRDLVAPAAEMPVQATEPEVPPKLRDAALILPLLGAFLLLPPLPLVFMSPARLAGIPLIVLYIFGVWLVLILTALWLARRLQGRERGQSGAWPPADTMRGRGPG